MDNDKRREQAFDTLDAWMSKFYKIAKIAIGANPQWLKKLGVMLN